VCVCVCARAHACESVTCLKCVVMVGLGGCPRTGWYWRSLPSCPLRLEETIKRHQRDDKETQGKRHHAASLTHHTSRSIFTSPRVQVGPRVKAARCCCAKARPGACSAEFWAAAATLVGQSSPQERADGGQRVARLLGALVGVGACSRALGDRSTARPLAVALYSHSART